MFGGSSFSVVSFASAPGFIYTALAAEDVTIVGAITGAVDFSCITEQSAATADTTNAGTSVNSLMQELSTAQDSPSSVTIVGAQVIESAEIAEIRNKGGGYSSGSFASGPFDGLGEFTVQVSGDSIFCTVDINSAVVEQLGVSDLTSRQIIVPRTITESSAGLDSISGVSLFAVSVNESTTTDLVFSSNAIFTAQVVEIISSSDTLTPTISVNSDILEFASATSLIINSTTQNAVVSENVVAQEVIPTTAQVFITIAESIRAADEFIARSLWEPINTFEPQSWTAITTAQLELRVTVGGGFSSGSVSSGPYSGLGGVTTIIPADEIWVIDGVAQSTDWSLVDTIN